MQDELVSVREAARILNTSEKTITRRIKRGVLKPAAFEKPATGGTPGPMLARRDVERLAHETAQQQLVPVSPPAGQTAVQTTRGVSPALKLLTDAMARAVPLHELPVLTVPEAARLAHWPAHELRAAISAGELPARKVGRGVKIWRVDLDAWLEANRPGAQGGKPKRSR